MEKISIRKIRWVYFLWNWDSVVYIWSSTNIISRIWFHLSDWKMIFDKYSYEELEENINLEEVEYSYIQKMLPMYNKNLWDSIFQMKEWYISIDAIRIRIRWNYDITNKLRKFIKINCIHRYVWWKLFVSINSFCTNVENSFWKDFSYLFHN